MSFDPILVKITVYLDPNTQDLTLTGDGTTVVTGDSVVNYILDDKTGLGLTWSGMSFRVNEPSNRGMCLSAQINPKAPNIISVSCTPTKMEDPFWGSYRFYLSFTGSKGVGAGVQWSFDPVIDCEDPH